MKIQKLLVLGLMGATALLSSCGGGGGGGQTISAYTSPTITVNQFVNALNTVDGAPLNDESEVILYTDETERSTYVGQDDWFVIYDAEIDQYRAVSLQYIRTIVYYDVMRSDTALADEYRYIEAQDFGAGFFDGDFGGDDYETVDLGLDGYFYGRESGYAYEDEVETTDVNLMAANAQEKAFARKAANLSYAYQVSMPLALSLVSLGEKAEGMLKKGAGQEELTLEDQEALLGDVEKITGVTLEEVIAAGSDSEAKSKILNKIASKNAKDGITAQKLEDRILPELFGLNL